ncbi:ABC transporter permease [Clostridia bacterium]|nr:ABC transporter permease [Clostridia bacterium]
MDAVIKKRKFKKETPVRKRKGFRIAKIIVFALLAVHAFSLLFPVAWAFLYSLKSQVEATTGNINALPKQWLFGNYADAFKVLEVVENGIKRSMPVLFLNSLWYSIGAAFLGIFVSSMSAYAVAKYDAPGRKVILNVVIVTMMIPIIGSLPSQYRLFSSLGIINTPFYLLVFAGGLGFNFLILYGYFRNLPWSYAEAAFIDGAGHVGVFFRVMMPQAVPLFTALGALALIGAWNDYTGPLLFLRSYPTLSSGLYILRMMSARVQNMPVLYAGILLSAVPVIVLFAFFSGKIMDISLGGGLKG